MSPALDLLDMVVEDLRTEIAPDLSGDLRYRTLLCASAAATARRECALAEALAQAKATLGASVNSIRDGDCDSDGALHLRLKELACLRAYIADPAALDDSDRDSIERLLQR